MQDLTMQHLISTDTTKPARLHVAALSVMLVLTRCCVCISNVLGRIIGVGAQSTLGEDILPAENYA